MVTHSVFRGGTSLPVTNTIATFKIRITPLSHSLMPAPSVGDIYALSPIVTGWTGTNTHAGSDTNAATTTIDNQSLNNSRGWVDRTGARANWGGITSSSDGTKLAVADNSPGDI